MSLGRVLSSGQGEVSDEAAILEPLASLLCMVAPHRELSFPLTLSLCSLFVLIVFGVACFAH
jgi:hypothetical protein